LNDHRHQHALRFDFSGAACFEMLFEQDAFMSNVLVDDPESLSVYGDDEAGTDLAERLQVGDLIGMGKRGRQIAVGPGQVSHPVRRCPRYDGWRGACKRRSGLKGEALLDGFERDGRKIKTTVNPGAGCVVEADWRSDGNVFYWRNDRARNARLRRSRRYR